ncbi:MULTISPECIES: acyl-CoA dehydrogenase family protein [unclassified Streptomyces]|uniref:acyl-CoA dehydrogenase family protein n=1 Tax=unclassified Streptomyces TaxID=2593676 RepID=UPI0007EDD865|nr:MULTISPECIES: acyl-CoA dehydrogenase family protein [unclassified Streptomyces]MCP3768073.1 acyl-CoA dehydrogenase family protein [Streptomyces sp. MAR25Y5]OBQ53062.1 acyl-CoA dehydrogenase [Streptomyces sp. H-KF8]
MTAHSESFLRRLRHQAREFAETARSTSLELDRAPSRAAELLLDGPLPWRQLTGLPAEYADDPLRVDGRPVYLDRCAEQVVVLEELARGDAAAVLALPGPSMSGHVVAELADPEQRDRYYRRLADRPTWTFFGMTEPAHGSDPSSMTTVLRADGDGAFRLDGTKRFVGNGARAGLGVVFARRNAGPLGVTAVLVDTDRRGFSASALPTSGLRGLQLSELRLCDVPVERRDVLGHGRGATRQGMWAATRTFNRFRPVVSCLALGVAQAAYDYVCEHRRRLRTDEDWAMARFAQRLTGVRALVADAARSADRDPADGTLASAAKLRATRLAEDLTTTAVGLFGPGARWDHPLLDKWVRDARAFEFMEGTGNIQRQVLAQGYLHGRLADERAA